VRHLCFECVTTTTVMHKVYIVWCLQVFLYLLPVRSRPFPVVTSIFGGRAVGVLFCGREAFIWRLVGAWFRRVAGVSGSGAAAGGCRFRRGGRCLGGPIFCSFYHLDTLLGGGILQPSLLWSGRDWPLSHRFQPPMVTHGVFYWRKLNRRMD